MVKLYYCRVPEAVDESIVPYLSEYRQNRLASVSCSKTRRQGICAELLLEIAVSDRYSRPLPILTGEHGKPCFNDEAVFFSLSHSENWAACAVADTELGLDIQTVRNCSLVLAKRFFTEDEAEFIKNSDDPDLAFTEIWCRKESRLKAEGIGLQGGIKSFSVFENKKEYANGTAEDFCYSVCVPGCPKIEIELIKIKLL